MWTVYFNIWTPTESDDPNKVMDTACIIVPLTRWLTPNQEEALNNYFNEPGMKTLPPGLPYVDGGQIYGIHAQTAIELEKLAADKGLAFVSVSFWCNDKGGYGTMCVKRMKVTGQDQLEELCKLAIAKANAACGRATQPQATGQPL